MKFFDRLFGRSEPAKAADEHALIVHFAYGSLDFGPITALTTLLEKALRGVGEYDGDELAADGSDGYFYMYGPNADRLFDAARPVLESVPWMQGASARLRYGKPGTGARERTVTLGAQ